MFVQYIRIQNGFFLVIFLVISIGCAESDRSNHFEKLEGNEQEIIFGTRSNENIAHIAWEAETASPGIQYKQWQQVTTARNSAYFWSELPSPRTGTMVAASAGQYLTAHHVISAILKSGAELSDYVLRFPEGWRFDNVNPGNYVDSNGEYLSANGYFIKNSWYLRYRLKSLGLDDDAATGDDESALGALFIFYKYWNISTDFTHWADTNGYRDIAAIQVDPKEFLHITTIPKWKAIGPGVFHDYRKPKAYREALNEGDPGLPRDPANGDSLAGFFVHFPLRPAADPPQDFRESLVGRDAIVRSTVEEKPCKNATTGDPDYCDELYGHYVRTNLDLKPGSSGGGVNWYPSAQGPGYFVGIIKGCEGSKCPDIDPESEVGQLDNDHATIFTPFDESISEHIEKKRGLHGTGFPIGHQSPRRPLLAVMKLV